MGKWVPREQEVTVMPAKCLPGDDLLGMLAHACTQIQLFCVRDSGRQKLFTGTYNSLLVIKRKMNPPGPAK